MEISGMNRQETEQFLNRSVNELMSGMASEDMISDDDYPHFLPSDNVRKFTVRVSLKEISPIVWRKFQCPSNISLRHLIELVIRLMGWENEHLNHIQTGSRTFYVPRCQDDPEMEWGHHLFQEDFMLSDILNEKGGTVRWEYDFGDSWLHEIRLSSIDEYKPDEPHDIVFKGGRQACPPENCGGVWGFRELMELYDRHQAHKRLTLDEKERLVAFDMIDGFDPEFVDESGCRIICRCFSSDRASDNALEMSEPADGSQQDIKVSPLYDDVMSLALDIRKLEPWIQLDDSDIYAVRMDDGSELYVATMGYGGESFEIQLFDGPESFQVYHDMVKGISVPDFELQDACSWADYRTVMYLDSHDELMEPELYGHLARWAKTHNVRIELQHGCPLLQHFMPHRYQSMMMNDEQGLARTREALEAVLWLSRQIRDTDDLTRFGFSRYRNYVTPKGGKIVPLIVRTAGGYRVEKTKLPGRTAFMPVIMPESDIQPLSFLQKKGTKYCRLIHMPGFIGSKDDKEHSYQSLVFLCLDKKSDRLSVTEPCIYSDNMELEALRQFVKLAEKEMCLPQRIITDNARTEACLKDLCKKLGIILELSRTPVPQLTDACRCLFLM